LPLLVIALPVSTLSATGCAARAKLPTAVESTLIVTPVLPVWAATAGMPAPVHATVVPLGGAVPVHDATADGANARYSSTAKPSLVPSVFSMCLVLSLMLHVDKLAEL
jgi:hypothetical protein